jgi:prepilin-type N-terminal cleavage/methylation domain-containing protein
MMRLKKTSAFTLIELLTVVAIIGVLAGIIIPTVGAVRKQANIAASKAQLSGYINAIQLFKAEYKFLPFVTGNEDVTIDLSDEATSRNFIHTLSGRNPQTGNVEPIPANRRAIAFHSFSQSEFYVDPATDIPSRTELADRFFNKKIKIRLDGDGDGEVTPDIDTEINSPAAPAGGSVRSNVTAWVEENIDNNYGSQPGYALWD